MATAKTDDVDNAVETVKQSIPATVLQAGATSRIADEDLRKVESFDDAVKLAAAQHGVVDDFAEKYGTGFGLIDRALLVGKTIVLLEWRFSRGDFGDFVSVVVMSKDGIKGIINDGSTGIMEQLKLVTADEGKYGGVMVARGLRVSDYTICPECDAPRPQGDECKGCGDESDRRSRAQTYYLDQSPA